MTLLKLVSKTFHTPNNRKNKNKSDFSIQIISKMHIPQGIMSGMHSNKTGHFAFVKIAPLLLNIQVE